MLKSSIESWSRRLDMLGARSIWRGLVLGAGVLGVLAMMIVELPPLAVDVGIASNVALSVALLLVALSVRDASQLASLPSLLLVATLFRLALNVATTRLVLLNGEAGQVVEAFGRVVVAGNAVVGAVVFVVLAIVQFVVVAKGSERVAEVAARFTLDALPGKQMSIDADLRAGALTLDEAQERRVALERESQLYGALDGAMKFVKGDAVAGLAIVGINVVGGFAVGVLQRGMALGEAASHYTVLTVGDGLAAQIPSLLVSTTAGLVVTRVPGGAGSLGADVTEQLSAHPRALAVAAGTLGAVALAPGFPAAPFLFLGTALGALAWTTRQTGTTANSERASASRPLDRELVLAHGPVIRVSLGERAHVAVERGPRPLSSRVPEIRRETFARLGVRFPDVDVALAAEAQPGAIEISIGALTWARESLPTEPAWVEAALHEIEPFGIAATHRPVESVRGLVWTDDRGAARALEAGYRSGDSAAFAALVLSEVLVTGAPEFVGIQEARELADALEATHPALVAEVVPRLVPLAHLAEVLRRLVAEGVSIRDTRAVFEALATSAAVERDPVALVESIRGHLRRQLTHDIAGGAGALAVWVLEPEVEAAFYDALPYARPGGAVPVAPAVARAVASSVERLAAEPRERGAPPPVLVVPPEIRRLVRSVVECSRPDVRVYSFAELLPSVTLRPVALVG